MTVCMEAEQQRLEADTEQRLTVCFVCTGNTCRSPMAAAVANALAQQLQAGEGSPRIVAFSAGLYAADGECISPRAVDALEAAGIPAVPERDYHAHRAHTLTAEEAERADLLVGMSAGHCMELLMRYPQAVSKIAGMPESIADPYGGDGAVYAECLTQIIDGVKALLFSSYSDGEASV